uniref:(California timema) hypothetical protein n=1 Tax=Timema californicum TaxID=61474 RepID=A0A7R9IWZ3_TIMCA|nr:unnamed protein product [Timema californicum]
MSVVVRCIVGKIGVAPKNLLDFCEGLDRKLSRSLHPIVCDNSCGHVFVYFLTNMAASLYNLIHRPNRSHSSSDEALVECLRPEATCLALVSAVCTLGDDSNGPHHSHSRRCHWGR